MAATVAFAADLAPVQPGYFVTIGVGPEVISSFPGAKTVTVVPNGHFDWRKPGDPAPFYAPDDGFDIPVLDLSWIKAGPDARFTLSRGLSGGNGAFFGLHNEPLTGELGAFVEFWPWQDHLRTRFELRQAVNGHRGLVGNVEIDAVDRIGPLTLSLGPRIDLGNSTYMNAYFGVTPAEALANGRVTPYAATGGVTQIGLMATARYEFTPNWSLTGYGGYDRLVNSAASSPIPNVLGSKNQYQAGLILAYSFNFGGLGF
jgi:hypothetical protein